MGALSFSPSPMTTTPRIWTVAIICRIASTATPSAPSLSPRPTQRAAASAAASVTRTSSSARLRSGESGAASRLSVMRGAYRSGNAPQHDDRGDQGERREDERDPVELGVARVDVAPAEGASPEQVGQGAGPGQAGADVEAEQRGEDRGGAERRHDRDEE